MFKVFQTIPWIMPAEPALIQSFFYGYGTTESCRAGSTLRHGGPDGSVSLLTKGLVTFSYLDAKEHYQTLALVLPGRTIGDIGSLDPTPCSIVAECVTHCEFLVLPHDMWLNCIRSSVGAMEAYANSANHKHQCTMEGMIANYTEPLETRLKLLLYSLISTHYVLRSNDWNPCPTHLTITDISHVLASNRSWVSRTISAWIEQGLVKKDGRRLLIHASLFDDLVSIAAS